MTEPKFVYARFFATFMAKVPVTDSISDAISNINIPENDDVKYLPNSFSLDAIFDEDENPIDIEPHLAFEYDPDYWGGNYDKTGQFAYVPICFINEKGSPEDAFEEFTGIDKRHIVHYSLTEVCNKNGEPLP
jgi:hypothetical protein